MTAPIRAVEIPQAVPDLRSDIVGRVHRLPLKPSDRNALIPIMEAVSNSIYAITERFGEGAMKRGRIDISVIRDLEAEGEPVVGFEVEDNGIGFTEENYNSFLTPDSRLNEQKGRKGVGRLAWLKVFEHVDVNSVFTHGAGKARRRFRFQLADHNQVEEILFEEIDGAVDQKTRVTFLGFESLFASRCPAKPGTIAIRILAHFVPLFIGGNAPKVIIHDGEPIDIEALFTDSIEDHRTTKVTLDFGGEQADIEIWSLKCRKSVRFDGGGYNFGFVTGHKRSVLEYSLDDQLGLKLLDGESIYLGSASGEYLDRHVNAERTGFTLDSDELDSIKRAIAREARDFLTSYVEEALARKVATTKELIVENPQFLYLANDVKKFAETVQPNVFGKEDLFVELSRNRFRRNRTFKNVEKTITSAHVLDTAIHDKIREYTEYVSMEKKGALAEYVTKRKAVIDLFEKFLEYKDQSQETYQREDAIHQLICPMRLDSSTLSIDDHNLWLLDDRLAFFQFFASDKPVNSYTGVEGLERPDLSFFYDTCVAWRGGENTDTVVLVEFKRPMRDDYTGGRDPVQQILEYVKLLRTEVSVTDVKGRAIRGITLGTSFHCYVVADITPTLDASIIGRYNKTPDGQGRFGYSPDPPAFVEIVPYGKILGDAKMRNAMFFKTLGLTEEV